MSRKLGRYILSSLVVSVLLTTGALTMILCVGLTMRLVMNEGLQLVQLSPVVQHLAIRSLAFTLPLGILTGTILTYGRLSAAREFQAAQWCGVRPAALYWPGLLLGIAGSLAAWVANDFWIPRSQYRLERAVENSVADLALLKLTHGMRDASFRGMPLSGESAPETSAPLFHLFVRYPQPEGTLGDIHIFELDSERGHVATAVYFSKAGRIEFLGKPRRAQLTLAGLDSVHLDPEGNIVTRVKDPPERPPIRYTFPMPKPFQQVKRQQLDSGELLAEMDESAPQEPDERRDLRIEFVERHAAAAAAFAFALAGIPLGLFGRRGNFFAGLSLALGVVFLFYYPAMMLGRVLAGPGWLWTSVPLGAPAAILCAAALLFSRRVLRRQV